MNEEIKQIAERIKGLREALDLSQVQVAYACNIPLKDFQKIESGCCDISVSLLHQLAKTYGVELTTLMFGDEPKMSSFFVTRKGQGLAVERVKAYKYQSLAAGFANRNADPFVVTVQPSDAPIFLNNHAGQEFNLVLSGTMLLEINGKEIVLNEGDSIYFNANLPHGMKALNDTEVKFLAVII